MVQGELEQGDPKELSGSYVLKTLCLSRKLEEFLYFVLVFADVITKYALAIDTRTDRIEADGHERSRSRDQDLPL